GLSQPRHPDLAVWRNQRQKATALSSRQGLSAIGIAARSWLDCQSFLHLSLANNRKRSPRSDSALGGPASRHGQTYQLGSMKISSQLENNFDYCSTEIEYLLIKNSLLCALSASAVNKLRETVLIRIRIYLPPRRQVSKVPT